MSWAAQTDGLAADQKRIDSGEDEGDDDDDTYRPKDVTLAVDKVAPHQREVGTGSEHGCRLSCSVSKG